MKKPRFDHKVHRPNGEWVPAAQTDIWPRIKKAMTERERAKREAEDARKQVTDLLTRKPLCK